MSMYFDLEITNKEEREMCPLEHVWPASQHSFKQGAKTIKQQYKMGNQFKALNEKKNSNLHLEMNINSLKAVFK